MKGVFTKRMKASVICNKNVNRIRDVIVEIVEIIVNEENVKELNFNLVFLTICHNFYNLVCKKPNLPNVYF
jgi:hypothetical protein